MKGNLALSRRSMSAAALGTALLIGAQAPAESPPPEFIPDEAAIEQCKAEVADPAIDQADALQLARQLAKYGRTHQLPTALVVAAQILAATPTRTGKLQMDERPDKGGAATAAKPRPKIDVETLLGEARAMAPDNKPLLSLAGQVPTGRIDASGGSLIIAQTIRGHTERTTALEYRSGREAYIGVSGDGGADLDCWVYDPKGKLVASATDAQDECHLHWVPQTTGKYKLHVMNRSDTANDFVILTN
jgi:hypothetical protein